MTELRRRRDDTRPEECWLIYYGDVLVGTIAARTGGPRDEAKWDWKCGFYPGTEPGDHRSGSADTFQVARTAFEAAWEILRDSRTEADFQAWRNEQAITTWKYAMWEAGAKLPTQTTSGVSGCFCGVTIDIAGTDRHVLAAHPFGAD
ncbi:hypothetical protein [Bradyrhizobium sp. Ai1a-2]|uniref:hypothetical protein n=1 Tax=Bradyrhizobium sp. Ai1a-2 TaxID=196490 RepID=UPI0003FC0EBB|nr:hypothetical protein [Bradyrhizobium sp. Ai1a-2]